MNDFWIACGYQLLDHNASGGLVVTDELLKAYFARPELMRSKRSLEPHARRRKGLFDRLLQMV